MAVIIERDGVRYRRTSIEVREDLREYAKEKGFRLHIHSGSSNLIDEVRTYKYRETKDGKVLDEPVPFNDHLMDCIRYILFTMHGPRKCEGKT